jgi:hypothetical protein
MAPTVRASAQSAERQGLDAIEDERRQGGDAPAAPAPPVEDATDPDEADEQGNRVGPANARAEGPRPARPVVRAAGAPPPKTTELSHLWVEPLPPLGMGNADVFLRGYHGDRTLRPGIELRPWGFDTFPRLLPEGDNAFRLTLSEEIAAGPMLGRNVNAGELLRTYPSTLPQELGGGRRTFYNRARIEASGAVVRDRLFFYAEALEERDVGAALGASADESVVAPKLTGNLTWQPTPRTRVSVGGRFDAFSIDNYGLSAWTFASAARERRVDQTTLVVDARHKLTERIELGATYDLVLDREDARARRGIFTPGHYNLGSFQTWGNYPFTDRRRALTHRLDAHVSAFVDGLFFRSDAHTFTLGAQVETSSRSDDQTRNGGFSYTDDLPGDAANINLSRGSVDENDRASWQLFSSDRGDELHAKTFYGATAVYLRDKIAIGSRFVLTPGVRFERFTGGFEDGPTVWRTNTLAPRASAKWQATRDGRTTLYGSAGRHFQNLDPSFVLRARQGAAYSPLEYWDWTGDPNQAQLPGINDPAWQRTYQFPAFIGSIGDVRHPHVDRFVVGLERIVDALDLVGRLRYEHRRYGDMVALYDASASLYDASANPSGTYDIREYVLGPAPRDTFRFWDLRQGQQPDYVIGNPEGARRAAHVFEASFRQTPFRWLAWRGLFRYTVDRGNLDTLTGLSLEWRDPSGRLNSYGNMPGFDPVVASTGATFDLPLAVRVMADYTFFSGQYFSRVARVLPTVAPRTFVYDALGRGGYQAPSRHIVDLRIERPFRILGPGTTLVWLQVYNLFNDATVIGFREPANYFRSVRRLQAPREIHVGVRYDF